MMKKLLQELRDVTDRIEKKEMETRLYAERYQSIVEHAAEGVYLCDVESCKIVMSNASMERLLGYGSAEMVALTAFDIIADSPENIQERMAQTIKETQLDLGIRPYRRKDGSIVQMEVSSSILTLGGRPTFCTICRPAEE